MKSSPLLLALLALGASPALAESEADKQAAKAMQEVDKLVADVVPSAGDPSYQKAIVWLVGHTNLHAKTPSGSSGGLEYFGRIRIDQCRYSCVIMEVQTSGARNIATGRIVTTETLFFVSLARANPQAFTIDESRSSLGITCVSMKGTPGLVVRVKDASTPPETSSSNSMCYDTPENATRAANAYKHLATLCGAVSEKEPF